MNHLKGPQLGKLFLAYLTDGLPCESPTYSYARQCANLECTRAYARKQMNYSSCNVKIEHVKHAIDNMRYPVKLYECLQHNANFKNMQQINIWAWITVERFGLIKRMLARSMVLSYDFLRILCEHFFILLNECQTSSRTTWTICNEMSNLRKADEGNKNASASWVTFSWRNINIVILDIVKLIVGLLRILIRFDKCRFLKFFFKIHSFPKPSIP